MTITQVNSGIYCIKSHLLCNNIQYLKNENNQSEYYLTDVIEIIKNKEQVEVGILNISQKKIIEITGINTMKQLRELEDNIIYKNTYR